MILWKFRLLPLQQLGKIKEVILAGSHDGPAFLFCRQELSFPNA